ncbi:Transcriptional regulator, LysR family [gamma proteobacterium HdN1]|nr:Transcriptional regulator, LysR family [gamma proteobacterium HdN1]
MRLSLRQLQIFVAVAESGSTVAASERLPLSQSAISAAVNELERLLSFPLFDRVGRRLQMNDNGRTLMPQALALLDGAAGIERMAYDADAQRRALRIGASTTIGSHVLPTLLARFLAGQPQKASDWKSSVAISNTAAICARVAAWELDIGLIEGPCHEASLLVEPWLEDDLVVVMPVHASCPSLAGHSVTGEAFLTIEQLRDAVWLLREAGSGTRESMDQALLPFLGGYRRSIELGNSQAILHGVVAELGLACLSRWSVNDWVDAGRLQLVKTPLPRLTRRWHWVVHRDKQFTQALRRLIDLL